MNAEIGFGGGCHWCTEAVFQSLRGVCSVQQGFIKSFAPHDGFSEAVWISYDPDIIEIHALIEIHLRTHASMSDHKMRGKYRSAVYVKNAQEAGKVNEIIAKLQSDFDEKIITLVLTKTAFKASDERFHNYYFSDPSRPFCENYIDPKLKLLRQKFSKNLFEQ